MKMPQKFILFCILAVIVYLGSYAATRAPEKPGKLRPISRKQIISNTCKYLLGKSIMLLFPKPLRNSLQHCTIFEQAFKNCLTIKYLFCEGRTNKQLKRKTFEKLPLRFECVELLTSFTEGKHSFIEKRDITKIITYKENC